MLLKEEQKKLCELYLKWQGEYNETHNKDILWIHIRPLLVDMIGNTVKKLSKGHYISDFEHRLECQVDRVIKRYIDNPQYNRELPMTIAYWEAVNMLYSSGHEKLIGNYDHEDEYYNASYDDESSNTKLVDIGKGNRIFMDYDTKDFYFISKGENTEAIVKALCENGWNLLTNK